MPSASLRGRLAGIAKRVRFAGPWIALAIALGSIAALLIAAERAHRDLLDLSNHSVALAAEAYLAVVTPAPGGSYHPARLVSGAGALAGTSFWPGGLQVAVGRTPLLPDTIGLVIPADSVLARDESRSFALDVANGTRAAVVPFRDRARTAIVGWIGAWETLEPFAESRAVVLFGILAFTAAVVLGVTGYRGSRRPVRDFLVLASAGAAALMGLALRHELRESSERATATHLLLTRKLIELAATADGVRSSALAGLAPGLILRRSDRSAVRADTITWTMEYQDKVGSVIAQRPFAVPFELRGVVKTAELDRADRVLLGIWCLMFMSLVSASEAYRWPGR